MSASPDPERPARDPATPSRAERLLLPFTVALTGLAFIHAPGPELTLVNDGFVVARRWSAWLPILGAALAWALVARWPRAAWHRALGVVLALLLAGIGVDRALDRLRVDGQGLSQRGLLGTRSLSWNEITRVDTGTARLIAWAGDERQVSVSLDRWKPEQRATLERSIARRVREVGAAAAR